MTIKEVSYFLARSERSIRRVLEELGIVCEAGKVKIFSKEEVERIAYKFYKKMAPAIKDSIAHAFEMKPMTNNTCYLSKDGSLSNIPTQPTQNAHVCVGWDNILKVLEPILKQQTYVMQRQTEILKVLADKLQISTDTKIKDVPKISDNTKNNETPRRPSLPVNSNTGVNSSASIDLFADNEDYNRKALENETVRQRIVRIIRAYSVLAYGEYQSGFTELYKRISKSICQDIYERSLEYGISPIDFIDSYLPIDIQMRIIQVAENMLKFAKENR